MTHTLLFDLDGTLLNTEKGILQGLRNTLEAFGVADPGEAVLLAQIGPPLEHAFAGLLPDLQQVGPAVEHYRDYYDREGKYLAHIYQGMAEALSDLAKLYRIKVVTSKREVFANFMTEYFQLSQYLEEVIGVGPENLSEPKSSLIKRAIGSTGTSPSIMIGDRKYDLDGANANQIPSIGVLWGFGSKEEFVRHGATTIASHPSELAEKVAQIFSN